ncbi:MAG: hypothetical protein M3N38_05645 [Pseudomonadota bacterium]|nr:hypothetical protein [Pseudomonadota bacterium]
MSRFFDGLRAKLSCHFTVREIEWTPASDTRDVTFAAFLPDETASIEMVDRISTVRRLANGSAERLESQADLRQSGGLAWRLTMTFYLGPGAAEHAAMEGKIADLALALGGRIAAEDPVERRAA